MPINPKMEAARRRPLADAALETLAAMVDEDLVLLTSSSIQGHGPTLMALDGRGRANSDKLPFKLGRAALDALSARGYVDRGDRDKLDDVIRGRWAAAGNPPRLNRRGEPLSFFLWQDLPHVVTEAGRAALEAERGRLADIRAARRDAQENPRFVVAARARYGTKLPGAGQLLRVVKETDSRFVVEVANEDGTRAEQPQWSGLVKGNGSNQYIEKADVIAVDVTPAQWRAMRRATDDFSSSVSDADSQAQAEIAPILRRAEERKAQLMAQLEDEMREAMGKAAGAAPAPRGR